VGIVVGLVSRKWKGAILIILNGIICLIVGSMLLFYPLAGVIALTLLIGVMMIIQGIFEMIKSRQLKQKFWKNLLLTDGIFCLLLGILVTAGWPSDSIFVIGLLLGLTLLFAGITATGIGMALNKK
jgi:uncharacterized membrane protein HdeD (DUF308 family)